MEVDKNVFNIALCQFAVSDDKALNTEKMEGFVGEAMKNNPTFVSLPEMWNCPYIHKYFREFAESLNGPSVKKMKELARKYNIFLIGGSIPEFEDEKLYNTSFVFNPSGDIIARHRKIHLFDIDIKKGHRFMESDTFTAGESETVIDTPFGKIGVALCFDIRFKELFISMRERGAKLIFLPAVFTMTTGPLHWELLIRSTALDNQIYLAANAQGRDLHSPFIAYGHSMIANPWGDISGKIDHREQILYSQIDFNYLEEVREQMPIL
jgi:predicted amidohydrolase